MPDRNPQQTAAERGGAVMRARRRSACRPGMRVRSVAAGRTAPAMAVSRQMPDGRAIGHGGPGATPADPAVACAGTAKGRNAVPD